jgi:hypothetical protein
MRRAGLFIPPLLLACAGIPGGGSPGAPANLPSSGDAAGAPTREPTGAGATAGETVGTAADEPAWVARAVAEALAWEVMPGTEGPEDDGTRAAALRTFFLAHPEYADPALREKLAAEACGMDGTEEAHTYLTGPRVREPLVVQVQGDAWELLVGHADHHCTSDDWSWYSTETAQEAAARGAATDYGSPKNDVLVVQRDGVELHRYPLKGQAFVMLRAGADLEPLPYQPTSENLPALDRYFGPRTATPDGAR